MATLYVIGTPIGNLEDITLRALRVLKEADLILCEDTRVTKKLLNHFDIHKPLRRLDAHVEARMGQSVEELFAVHGNIALVTDAGTPGISDPGDRFITAARQTGISVIAIPGPSALSAALSISGLPASEFLFLGFLPHKKGRETLFKEIIASKRTVAFFESPHRLMKTLHVLAERLDSRRVAVARELTKMYEEVASGTGEEVLDYFKKHQEKIRGELVILIESR